MEGRGFTCASVRGMFVIAFGFFILDGVDMQFHTINIPSQPLLLTGCHDSCIFTLVESVPDNLTYPAAAPIMMSTYTAHKRLLKKAQNTIHLASFYWTLTSNNVPCEDNSSAQGEDIFNTLLGIVKDGKIEVKIAQNITSSDTDILAQFGAEVRTLDFTSFVGAGVMHTKMWLVDNQHIYIGSGNFDWRSYTQTKETGVLIENCPCLGTDVAKLFEVYWYLGAPNASIPRQWPSAYNTDINATSPILVHYNDTRANVYLSSSPPQICPVGRSPDIDAVLDVIRKAQKFIYISVMDYIPMVIYTGPGIFWPIIDDELRRAAIDRNVSVRLMPSLWKHSLRDMFPFLKSLDELHNTSFHRIYIQVKLFCVPSYTPAQKKIPFARVNHNKYMVTDQHAYIGTSNWSGDYFKSTGGVGFILEQPTSDLSNDTNLREQLLEIFIRDWESSYATPLHQEADHLCDRA